MAKLQIQCLEHIMIKKLLQKAKKTAIGAIMRKVTNIIFAVLRDCEPFVLKTPTEHILEHQMTLKLVA